VFQFQLTLICVSAVNVQTTDCRLNQFKLTFICVSVSVDIDMCFCSECTNNRLSTESAHSFPPLCENMHSEDVSPARMTRLVFVTSSSFHQTADLARQYVVDAVGVAGV